MIFTSWRWPALRKKCEILPIRASIVDLPVELLILILEILPELDCASLAFTNRRLHHIALPYALFKCGIIKSPNLPLVESLITLTQRPHSLRYLRSALFLDSMKLIAFTLAPGCRNLSEFAHLLSKPSLRSVEALTLDFTHVEFHRYNGRLVQYHERQDVAWDIPFRRLTQALAQRSCETLTILYGRVIEVGRYNAGSFFNPIPLPTRVLNRLIKSTSSSSSSTAASPAGEISPITTVKTLNIRSELIMQEPFLGWIVSTANMSPLTKLDLQFKASTTSWVHLLSSLFLPAISWLSIGLSLIPATAMVRFLIRHPTITVLDLCKAKYARFGDDALDLTSPHHPASHADPVLPRLAVLLATPEWLIYLLTLSPIHLQCPMFPKLQEIIIKSSDPLTSSTGSGFSVLDEALSALSLACGCSHKIALVLELSHCQNHDLLKWVNSIIRDDADEGRGSCGEIRSAYWSSMFCVEKFGVHLPSLTSNPPIKKTAVDNILKWITMLPSLRNILLCQDCWKWMTDGERRDLNARLEKLYSMRS